MPEPDVYNWSDRPADAPMDKLQRRRLIGDKAMLSHIVLEQGCFVPSHAHENEQFAIVLSGKARFVIGDPDSPDARTVEVSGSSDAPVFYAPSNVPHSCLALERTVILDVFSPPSQTTGVDHTRD